MKERQELVNSLNNTSSEMEHLKNLCQNLTLQLTMASGGTELRGASIFARLVVKLLLLMLLPESDPAADDCVWRDRA